MIRGISFQIPQMTSNILWKILSSIDIVKYSWYNIADQSEVWNEQLKNNFFDIELYSGNEFKTLIQHNHYIVFLKLQAYFDSDMLRDIHTYDEFCKSDCQMILLVNDCEFVEIYVKNKKHLKSIYQNVVANSYKNVEYITDKNDMRTVMDVI